MKLFIGAVVALLCIQAIDADCETDLAAYQADVSSFFNGPGGFTAEHDIAHANLVDILTICNGLNAALEHYLDPNTQLTDNDVLEFFDSVSGIFEQHRVAVKNITELRYACDVLLKLANDYRCNRNYVCVDNFTGSECEADTNDEKCNLLDFFAGLQLLGAETKIELDKLLVSCDELIRLARNFDCANCSGGQSTSNLVENFQNFIVEFNTEHINAHNALEAVSANCATLTAVCLSFA